MGRIISFVTRTCIQSDSASKKQTTEKSTTALIQNSMRSVSTSYKSVPGSWKKVADSNSKWTGEGKIQAGRFIWQPEQAGKDAAKKVRALTKSTNDKGNSIGYLDVLTGKGEWIWQDMPVNVNALNLEKPLQDAIQISYQWELDNVECRQGIWKELVDKHQGRLVSSLDHYDLVILAQISEELIPRWSDELRARSTCIIEASDAGDKITLSTENGLRLTAILKGNELESAKLTWSGQEKKLFNQVKKKYQYQVKKENKPNITGWMCYGATELYLTLPLGAGRFSWLKNIPIMRESQFQGKYNSISIDSILNNKVISNDNRLLQPILRSRIPEGIGNIDFAGKRQQLARQLHARSIPVKLDSRSSEQAPIKKYRTSVLRKQYSQQTYREALGQEVHKIRGTQPPSADGDYLIALRNFHPDKKILGHAVAMRICHSSDTYPDGFYEFFDVNSGWWQFTSCKDMHGFFKEYLSTMYGDEKTGYKIHEIFSYQNIRSSA